MARRSSVPPLYRVHATGYRSKPIAGNPEQVAMFYKIEELSNAPDDTIIHVDHPDGRTSYRFNMKLELLPKR